MKELPRQSGGLDINIEDGVDFSFTATYKIDSVAVDVTGYAATFTLRNKNGSTATALLELTSGAGITVGTTDGSFAISMTEAQSAFGNAEMVYDLVVTSPGGDSTKLLRGTCKSWAGAG